MVIIIIITQCELWLSEVLVLHGSPQNASYFKKKTSRLRHALEGIAELVYAEGPHPVARQGQQHEKAIEEKVDGSCTALL